MVVTRLAHNCLAMAACHEYNGDDRGEAFPVWGTVHRDQPVRSPYTMDAVAIFTGRGGSGTRLLSQLSTDAGVFLGNEVNRSGESVEWVDLVYRMGVETAGQ